MKTKEKLLHSAKKIFSEKGFYRTRVSDIVKDAGVSQGTFYIYFKSKEEIFKEIILELKEKIIEITKNVYGESIEDKLLSMNRAILEIIYENRTITEIFLYQLFSTSEEMKKIYFETVEKIRKILSETIYAEIKNGKIKNINPENVANILIGYKKMVFEDYIMERKLPKENILNLSEEGLKIILDGLKK